MVKRKLLILCLITSLTLSGCLDYFDRGHSFDEGYHELDMSSAESFIASMEQAYGIVLVDRLDILSGEDGRWLKKEIHYGLSPFSQKFIKAVTMNVVV